MKGDPLKEGSVYCDVCGGEGIIKDPEFSLGKISLCDKCKGVGQLDWIEMIVGKRSMPIYFNDMDVNTLYPQLYKFGKTSLWKRGIENEEDP